MSLCEVYGMSARARNDAWPEGDILAATRGEFPTVPTQQFQAGTTLYHGTAAADDFTELKDMSWLTVSYNDAVWYATREADGPRPIVVIGKLAKRVRLVEFPDVAEREAYRNAVFWTRYIFGTSFEGIGYQRLPQAFAAVCSAGYDGIYIAREDSNKPALMLCKVSTAVTVTGRREVS